jgi:hypothetical protein
MVDGHDLMVSVNHLVTCTRRAMTLTGHTNRTDDSCSRKLAFSRTIRSTSPHSSGEISSGKYGRTRRDHGQIQPVEVQTTSGYAERQAMGADPRHPREEKPENERGYYHNPELYDQPRENSTLWKGNPELIRLLEERRDISGASAELEPRL